MEEALNQLVPLEHAEPFEGAANLREAALQDEHAHRMRAIAHEVASRPNTLLDASDFLEMARQARCNAAVLRRRS